MGDIQIFQRICYRLSIQLVKLVLFLNSKQASLSTQYLYILPAPAACATHGHGSSSLGKRTSVSILIFRDHVESMDNSIKRKERENTPKNEVISGQKYPQT